MDAPLLTASAHMVRTIAFASLVVALLALVPKLSLRFKLSKIPRFGTSDTGETQRVFFLKYAVKLYREGYEKFKNSIYHMAEDDDVESVVVPAKFLPELKKLPDDVLDIQGAINKTLEGKHTNFLPYDHVLNHSVKADLTPALGRFNDAIAEEIDLSLDRVMPPCKEWTKVIIYQKLADLVAQVSGRILIGEEFCRDPEYIDHAVNFTNDLMAAVYAVKQCNPFFRRFQAPRLPEVRKVQDRLRRAKKFFEPIILSRLNTEQKKDDMLQWMVDHSPRDDPEMHMKRQLTITFAAIHTTSMTATNILYTLATAPEYIEPLREEIRAVMAEHDGDLNPRALQKLVKLDSFMKEVGRMYPASITSFARFVKTPFTLSNGQYVPAGVRIEVPLEAMNFDPNVYPDPDRFDGFRFYKLRQSGDPSEKAHSQFVSSNDRDLLFGYGRHACPGRFFATNEVKILLTRLLLDYDIVMPDGLKERYEQFRHDKMVVPDPEKPLLMKRIR